MFFNFMLFFLLYGVLSAQTEKKVIGYYRSWAKSDMPAQKIQFDKITHVIHAFIWPEQDGSLSYESDFLYPQLNQLAHQAGRKVLVSVGGAADSYAFSAMAGSSQSRSLFIDNIIDFLSQYKYDGLDLDWEFPQNENDKNNLLTLVSELRNKMKQENSGWLLTMAVPVSNYYGQWLRFDVLPLLVDWFNAMTYDFHGSWTNHSGHNAPLYASGGDACGSVDQGINYLTQTRAINKSKIVMGLAFYGRQFNTSGLYASATGGDLTYGYNDIIGKVDHGWDYYWDDAAKVPYLQNTQKDKLISFDDTTSVRIKCEYVNANDLNGVMIWALGHDLINGTQPLLETVARVLTVPTAIREDKAQSPQNLELLNCYPNPFNGSTVIEYSLSRAGKIRLSVLDALGRRVADLQEGYRGKGNYRAQWRAGQNSSGVYYVLLRAGNQSIIRKLVYLK